MVKQELTRKNSHSLERKNKKTRQFRKKRRKRRSKKHKQIIGGFFGSQKKTQVLMPKKPPKTLEEQLYNNWSHGLRPPGTHTVSSFEEYKKILAPHLVEPKRKNNNNGSNV